MPSGPARFNPILWLALGALTLGLAACRSGDGEDVEATTLRFHIQTIPNALDDHVTAVVGRHSGFEVHVDEDAFLSEIFITEATLVDVLGGFEIQITFDRKGKLILEQVTTAHKSKRIALYAQFGDSRWLAAPVIQKTIPDGIFTFTPDATREEAERIVRGLMNVASEVRKQNAH